MVKGIIMKKYRILIVDDDPAQSSNLRDIIDQAPDFELNVSYPADALKTINKIDYDLILIDLHFETKGEDYGGQHLATKIRKTNKKVYIIVYSGKLDFTKSENQELVKSYLESGIDEIKTRKLLARTNSDELIEHLRLCIVKKQQEILSTIKFEVHPDIKSYAAIEVISEITLSLIIKEISPDANEVKVRALRAGYSGALILNIKFTNKSSNQEQDIIIKLSKDENNLALEVARKPNVGSMFEFHGVFPSDIIQIDGWTVVYMANVSNAKSVRQWLKENKNTRENRRFIDHIINVSTISIIKNILTSSMVEDENYTITYSTAKSIIEEMLTISHYSIKIGQPLTKYINSITSYLNLVIEGNWKFQSNYYTKLQGDLHTENILIGEHNEIKIIDFGRSELFPRLFDIAALDVDLVLNVINVNKDDYFDFTVIDDLFKKVIQNYPFRKKPLTVSTNGNLAEYFRNKLLNSIYNEIKDVTINEYAEVLLFQYLRYLRFSTIPVPRRIVAIKIINKLISLLSLKLPKTYNSEFFKIT